MTTQEIKIGDFINPDVWIEVFKNHPEILQNRT